MCRYKHSSPLLQYPFLTKKLHSGILRRLYSCKNSHDSPFLQRPRSQCLHTSEPKPPEKLPWPPPPVFEEVTCRSGQWDLSGQLPEA